MTHRICDRQRNPKDVLEIQINKYRDVFKIAMERAHLIDNALADYLDERPSEAQSAEITDPPQEVPIFKCPKCGLNMVLRDRKQGTGKYIGCMGFPTCNNAIWFPQNVEGVEVLNEVCSHVNTVHFYIFISLSRCALLVTVFLVLSVPRKYAYIKI